MLKKALLTKRCLMVCGGGGVGKTTIAASIAIAGARLRPRVLVVTIDPAMRLLQAFGFDQASLRDGGEPLALSEEVKSKLGLPASASLSVAVLNPKYVLNQILEQTLNPETRERLKKTLLYSELSQMIYGLQEYTAYEWVTRMIGNNEYDLIVLDTPPAVHAKDFFNAPAKIKNLMESKVFQIFSPRKTSWISSMLSFGWVEKLLGQKTYSESKVFFETFVALRDRILERCDLLSQFFKNELVEVIAVGTPELTAQIELQGLIEFLKGKQISVETIVINQVEVSGSSEPGDTGTVQFAQFDESLRKKLEQVKAHQIAKAEKSFLAVERLKTEYNSYEVIAVPMTYSAQGFDILTKNSISLATESK